jgi:hypothetical protein
MVSGPTLDYVHEEIGSGLIHNGQPGGQRYYPDAVVPLDLAPEAEVKEVAVTLRRGSIVKGRIVGPNGEPVAKTLVLSRLFIYPHIPFWRYGAIMEARDGRFELRGCDPDKTYPVYFLDAEHGWGATVALSGKQAAGEPVTVRLGPCGKAGVRFLDAQGEPIGNATPHLELVVTPGPSPYSNEALQKGVLASDGDFVANIDRLHYYGLRTNAGGRCTLPALIPGATYRISVQGEDGKTRTKEFTVTVGQALDLGDIPMRRPQ